MSIESCPVSADVIRIQSISSDLTRTLRKLRRDLKSCSECPANDTCLALKNINSQIQIAITEITDEYNLIDTR